MESGNLGPSEARRQLSDLAETARTVQDILIPELAWWQPALIAVGTPALVAAERFDWFPFWGPFLIMGCVAGIVWATTRNKLKGLRTRRGSAAFKSGQFRVFIGMFAAIGALGAVDSLADSSGLPTSILVIGGFGVSWITWRFALQELARYHRQRPA